MIAGPACDRRLFAWIPVLALTLLAACARDTPVSETAGDTIVVFTTMPESAVTGLFDDYSTQTGSTVVLTYGEIVDIARLRDEHPDILIAGNLAELTAAAEQNILRPSRSEPISRRIPALLRDPEHLWVSLSVRARTIVYNKRLTSEDALRSITGYPSLADETWRGRLCLSSSTLAGNRSLIARLIHDSGLRETEKVVRGWRTNLPVPVFADDSKLLQAIGAGECAVGIADSSRIAAYLKAGSLAEVAPHWFADAGVTHTDSSGAGVTRHARNPDGALALLEWLTSSEANARFAAALLEFPANPRSSTNAALAAWPGFEAGPVNIANLGFLLEDASKLAERARYP